MRTATPIQEAIKVGVARTGANPTRNHIRGRILAELREMSRCEAAEVNDREAWETARRIETLAKQLREHVEDHGV